MLSFSVWRNRR